MHAEILQAFENVGRVLKAAGVSWNDVVAIRSYHVGLNEEIDAFMIEQLRARIADHAPIFTIIGVVRLGDPHMHVEIEATAIIRDNQ